MEALLLKSTGEQGQAVTAGYTRLTDAKQMGSLFKTLVAASPGLLPPGFASNERR